MAFFDRLKYTLIRSSEFCSSQVLFFPHIKNIISTQNFFFFVLTVHYPKIISCPQLEIKDLISFFLLALIQNSPKSFNRCCLSLSLFSFTIQFKTECLLYSMFIDFFIRMIFFAMLWSGGQQWKVMLISLSESKSESGCYKFTFVCWTWWRKSHYRNGLARLKTLYLQLQHFSLCGRGYS